MNPLVRMTAVAAGFSFALPVNAQDVPAGVVMLDIQKAKWEKSLIGESAKIYGDQATPGPYSFLTKPRPAPGPASKPHSHPSWGPTPWPTYWAGSLL